MTDGERRMKIDRYRLEPYYPRIPERLNGPAVHYLLSTPMPLDREQMELILRVVSQFRDPEGWCTDGVMLDTRPRFDPPKEG